MTKIEKVVRCKGTWDEITALANVIDKLGLDWYRFSKSEGTEKVWVLEVQCKDLMIKW